MVPPKRVVAVLEDDLGRDSDLVVVVPGPEVLWLGVKELLSADAAAVLLALCQP